MQGLSDVSRVDWDKVAPNNFYAKFGHYWLDMAILSVTIVPALLVILLLATGNWIAYGDLRHVFFLQPRLGLRGKVFNVIKFRTMSEAKEGNFASWSKGDESRVTAFGKTLRNMHLDELPQILNVLRGDMSFVGPRPEMLEIEAWAQENVPHFSERLAIKPGITGLAQITQGYTGRDIEAYTEKLNICLAYMAQMSLFLDIKIIFNTMLWMLRGKGWQWKSQERINAHHLSQKAQH